MTTLGCFELLLSRVEGVSPPRTAQPPAGVSTVVQREICQEGGKRNGLLLLYRELQQRKAADKYPGGGDGVKIQPSIYIYYV